MSCSRNFRSDDDDSSESSASTEIIKDFKSTLNSTKMFSINNFEYMTNEEMEICVRMMIDETVKDPQKIKSFAVHFYHYTDVLQILRMFAKDVTKECKNSIDKFNSTSSWQLASMALFLGEIYMLDKEIISKNFLINWFEKLVHINTENSIDALLQTLRLCATKFVKDDAVSFNKYMSIIKNSPIKNSFSSMFIAQIEKQIRANESTSNQTYWKQDPKPSTPIKHHTKDFKRYLEHLQINGRFTQKFMYSSIFEWTFGFRKSNAKLFERKLMEQKTQSALSFAKFLKDLFMFSYSLGRIVKVLKANFEERIQKINENLMPLNELKSIGLFVANLTNMYVIDKSILHEYLETIKKQNPQVNQALLSVQLDVLIVAFLDLQLRDNTIFSSYLNYLNEISKSAQISNENKAKALKIIATFPNIEVPKKFNEMIYKCIKNANINSISSLEYGNLADFSELTKIFFLHAISNPLMSEYFASAANQLFTGDRKGKQLKGELITLCQTYYENHFMKNEIVDDHNEDEAIGTVIFIAELYCTPILHSTRIINTVLVTLESKSSVSRISRKALEIFVKMIKNETHDESLKMILRRIEAMSLSNGNIQPSTSINNFKPQQNIIRKIPINLNDIELVCLSTSNSQSTIDDQIKQIFNDLKSKSFDEVKYSILQLNLSTSGDYLSSISRIAVESDENLKIFMYLLKVIKQSLPHRSFLSSFIIYQSNDIKAGNSKLQSELFNYGIVDFDWIINYIRMQIEKNPSAMKILLEVLKISSTHLIATLSDDIEDYYVATAATKSTQSKSNVDKFMQVHQEFKQKFSTQTKSLYESLMYDEIENYFELISAQIAIQRCGPIAHKQPSIKNDFLEPIENFKDIFENLCDDNFLESVKRLSAIKVNENAADFDEMIEIFIKIYSQRESSCYLMFKLLKFAKNDKNTQEITFIDHLINQFHHFFIIFVTSNDDETVEKSNEIIKLTEIICKFYHYDLTTLDFIAECTEIFLAKCDNSKASFECIYVLLESTGGDFELFKKDAIGKYFNNFENSMRKDAHICEKLIKLRENRYLPANSNIFDDFLNEVITLSTVKLNIVENDANINEFLTAFWKQLMTNSDKSTQYAHYIIELTKVFKSLHKFIADFMQCRCRTFMQIPNEQFTPKMQEKLKFSIIFIVELHKFKFLTEDLDDWIHPQLIAKLTKSDDKMEIFNKINKLNYNVDNERLEYFMKNLENLVCNDQKLKFEDVKNDLNDLKQFIDKNN